MRWVYIQLFSTINIFERSPFVRVCPTKMNASLKLIMMTQQCHHLFPLSFFSCLLLVARTHIYMHQNSVCHCYYKFFLCKILAFTHIASHSRVYDSCLRRVLCACVLLFWEYCYFVKCDNSTLNVVPFLCFSSMDQFSCEWWWWSKSLHMKKKKVNHVWNETYNRKKKKRKQEKRMTLKTRKEKKMQVKRLNGRIHALNERLDG